MKKTIALVLALLMCLALFAGCGKNGAASADKPLVVGYSNFSSKFSPFFAETAYDQDVSTMTAVALLETDRQGAVVEKGKTSETRTYTGTTSSAQAPANLSIPYQSDATPA